MSPLHPCVCVFFIYIYIFFFLKKKSGPCYFFPPLLTVSLLPLLHIYLLCSSHGNVSYLLLVSEPESFGLQHTKPRAPMIGPPPFSFSPLAVEGDLDAALWRQQTRLAVERSRERSVGQLTLSLPDGSQRSVCSFCGHSTFLFIVFSCFGLQYTPSRPPSDYLTMRALVILGSDPSG